MLNVAPSSFFEEPGNGPRSDRISQDRSVGDLEGPSNTRPYGGLAPGPATFGNPSGQGAYLLLADSAVHWFASDTPPDALRALSTPGGGEAVPF